MYNLSDKRPIAIYGTGLDATKCIYYLDKKNVEYDCFIVSNALKNVFRGKKVVNYVDIDIKSFFVIVAVSYSTYPSVSKMLRNMNLKEFVDYVYYDYLDKELIYLHGNCHMNVIQRYMESASDFCSKYSFYHAPRLVSGIEPRDEQEIFDNIDWWIHQDIRDNNRISFKVSDTYIRKKLDKNKNFKEIIVPNLYGLGKGFFPQNRGEEYNTNNESITNVGGIDNNGMFCTPDYFMDTFVKENLSLNQMIEKSHKNIIDSKVVLDGFNIMIEKIKLREQKWDIKVSEFILQNYRIQKMFYDAYHPTNFVLHFISNEILLYLGKEGATFTDYTLDTHEEPIYPFVKEILNLEWEEPFIRKSKNAKKSCSDMDFKEYLREYAWWCYHINLS